MSPRYEVRAAVEQKSKRVFVCHTSIQVLIYALLSGTMIGLCAFDWHMNIDPVLVENEAQCSNVVFSSVRSIGVTRIRIHYIRVNCHAS